MTIATFCREQLLTGPLSLDDLVSRAVDAGVTRALNPHNSVLSAIRRDEIELLDGRWVTPLWLLEGRCLTAAQLPHVTPWYGEKDADLGLLGSSMPTTTETQDSSTVRCVRVSGGQVEVSSIPAPDPGTLEVAALAARLASLTPPAKPYGDRRGPALRAVAQLMVDDPTCFRSPLPPLSTWVPALVADARRCEEESRRAEQACYEQERRRSRQVTLDDCTAIEVQLAAERTGQTIGEWVMDAIDRALATQRPRAVGQDAVVISLGDHWR